MSCMTGNSRTVQRLVGVYNADGSAVGELVYFVGARLGRAHCELCDITHALVRERPEWKAVRQRLPVAFDAYHRNDQPDALRALHRPLPIVVAEVTDGFVALLGPTELAACAGSPQRLVEACERAVDEAGLRWPQ